MHITNIKNTRKYSRDNIVSHLLVSELSTGARHITTTLVEMDVNGHQHLHSHETEQSYFIIKGKGLMNVGDEECEVMKGDSIFIPSNAVHGLKNTGNEKLVYLSAGSPPFGRVKEAEFWPLENINR
ncbi:MAG: cupin domain-containing protein [Spirochaetes bacterium]|nr:cupin domain-containing protein [Spirochaetota bacterium]